jgi:hypothetical protein
LNALFKVGISILIIWGVIKLISKVPTGILIGWAIVITLTILLREYWLAARNEASDQ